jgi:hypothetical protein
VQCFDEIEGNVQSGPIDGRDPREVKVLKALSKRDAEEAAQQSNDYLTEFAFRFPQER